MKAGHLMVREQCVALHIVELAVARVWQLRRRRGNVLRRIKAQQVIEPRLHLVPSPIPAIARYSGRCSLRAESRRSCTKN